MPGTSQTRVLFVWEQGGGLGHLSHMRLPMEVALAQGAAVFLAARELPGVRDVLAGLPITLLQAPFRQGVKPVPAASFLSYTHLLARQCFGSADELEMYVRAWRALFALVQPDICLFEHSPTALIAAHGYAFKKVLLGASFVLPPANVLVASPFLPFPTTQLNPDTVAQLRADDAQLLAQVNAVMQRLSSPALPALGAIYGQAHGSLLCTWPLLDVFGERPGVPYLGSAPTAAQLSPPWPQADGPKVFGYLQNFPSLPQLLRDLQAAKVCALLLVRDLPPALRTAFSSPTLRFIDQLVDLNQVAQQAAWVLHHGNHSTMATFMLAGVPQLTIPRHQEQLFTGLQLVQKGGVLKAFQDQPSYAAAIAAVLQPPIKQRALQVASQCEPFDQAAVQDHIQQILVNLCFE
ncbi:hypothetical protein [Rhodoferax sp.]|uniref:glycosyltransferase n=1 Tax=Rhodoferax sp. TaxID=50421 RepID=UPI00271CCFBD|nr:hypothetical protein [Rhodoferax sp.]MDO8318651.1 hypothetical protein [Rhodoferax sp.]